MFKRLSRIVVTAFTLSLAVTGVIRADDAPAPTAGSGPDVALKTTVDQIRGMIRENFQAYKADSTKFYKAVDDVVVPRFDVPKIAQEVLGQNFRAATPDQRTRFGTAFKNMLVRSYANAMLDYNDSVSVSWGSPRISADGQEANVASTLTQSNGQPLVIAFRVHKVADDWKIIDITVENVSLVLNFRTQLNSEIHRTSLDDVIGRMEKGEFNAHKGQQQTAPAAGNGGSALEQTTRRLNATA